MDPLRLAELRSWWKVPCIAHFCSLFRGVLFEQSDLDIEDLEEALLQAISPGDSPVILDLLCSLLEGIYGREKLTVVDYDKYLKDIFRYQHAMGNIKRNPLVDKTYFELSLRQKVNVLHDLCDFRLESEDVMEVLKGHDGDNMRVEPLGHDVNGATYWYFYGTRLYQEDPPPREPEEEKSPKRKHKKKKKKTEREERAEKRKLKRKDQRQAKKERDAKKLAAEEKEKLEKEETAENGENSSEKRQRPSRRSKRIAVENLTGIIDEINDDDEDDEMADVNDDEQTPKSPEQMAAEAEVTIENQNGHVSEIDGVDVEKSAKLKTEPQSSVDRKEKLNIETDNKDKKVLVLNGEEKPLEIKTELQNGDVKLEENKDGIKTEFSIKDEIKTEIDDKTQIKSEIDDKDEIASKLAIEEIADICSEVVDALTQIKDNIIKEEFAPKAAVEEIADISSAVVDTLSQIKDDIVKQENCDFKAEDESKIEVDEKFESEKMESKAEVKESEIGDPKEDIQIDDSEIKTEENDDVIDSEVAKIMEEVLNDVEGYEESEALQEYVPEMDQVATEVEVETNGYGEEDMEEEDTSVMETEAIGPVTNEEPKPMEEEEEPRELSRWHMVCCTLEDWQNLAEFFKESEVKCEKALYRTIVEDFLPEIPNIVAEREKELARRESQNAPRRQSCRLEVKRIEQEEMEKVKATQDAEEEKLKLQEEERRMDRIRQARIEDQKRAREDRERVREERANRIKKREERARMLAEGIEIPEELRNLDSPPPEIEVKVKNLIVDNEVTVTMYKILDSVKNHPDSWLFWEPVEETFAPGYFEVVKNPMDLMRIESKVNEREYKTTDNFINDLHLMFDNCILYNGTDSDYAYMAESLRAHLKKVYKRLMPKEDPQEDTKDQVFEPIVKEPKTKPVKKKRPYVEGYHAMFEKEVMNDMRKVPPTKSSGTFKHGNYMVHMMPIRKVSKDTVFQEVDKEIEAYKAANPREKKYTKLPALALYPPTRPDTPVFDSNDPLANRFKRKVDPANVCKPSNPKPVPKPVEVGSPKVETLVSAENPAIKKNVWHISQEDMVKYRKIAQENGGFVEIKGPEGKTLKLQFKTVPKPGDPTTPGPAAPATPQTPAPGTPAVPPATTSTAVTPQTKPTTENVGSTVQAQAEVPDRKADVPSEAITPTKSGTPPSNDQNLEKKVDPCPETKLLEKVAEAALGIYKKAQQATPLRRPKDPNKKKGKDSPKSVKAKDQTAKETAEEGSELDQSNDSEHPMETSDVNENVPVDQSNESTEKSSDGLQSEDYESFKKGVEATNKQKSKSDPTKKKVKQPKNPEEKLSLDNLEKKIREGETLGEMTKIKKKVSDQDSKKKKDKTFNGVIIRGVHHANGLDTNEKSPKRKKTKPKVESVKGNDSDFDEDDDIPLKRRWHPVQQSPDKLKLTISRAEKESDCATPGTPSDSENTPSKGILKKFGTFASTPYTKIKHKLSVDTEITKVENDEPPKKRKRVSFSEKLSIRKLPPVGEPGMSEEHRVTTVSCDVETESAIENEPQETPSTSDSTGTNPDKSPSKPVLTTMQQKIKKLKSDSTPQKYVCDFDMDDDGLSPISKQIPRKPKTGSATVVPTRGPCSYLKTSSTSALRDKPHEFSVNAPKATRPKVLSDTPPKSKPRIISVINKTAKTVTSVEIPPNVDHVETVTKETVTKINSEENKPVKMTDSAVETEIDLECENEGEDIPEMDIDPEEQERAESLIKDLVKEITKSGSMRKKEKSKLESITKEKKSKVKDTEKKPKSNVMGDNSNSKSQNNSGLVSEISEKGIISDNNSKNYTKDRANECSDLDVQDQNNSVPEGMDDSEELERDEANMSAPNLDKDQVIETMDTDMPTLEPIKDSEMPELSQEYDDISDENEEMPTLEESPDIRLSDNSKSEIVKNSKPSENSSEITKSSSETSPIEKTENAKQTSSEKKKYRDREHPFFSDPIMISLYSKESNTPKINLMDSFMQLGQISSETKDTESSSASTSNSTSSSTIPSLQETQNDKNSSS